ncbi:MAG: T9SS type A sorting domain-containing protein, partial [Flavobacteriales bacterium]|nr:T9SS type A sorting domain-containing protein [Flavobacteriales bacterium]
ESLSCYPNPFIDEVFIKNACGEVQVYDALGRFIFNKKISDSKVDLSNIEKGKYWIRCSNSKPIPIIKR